MEVKFTDDARDEFKGLPMTIQARIRDVAKRLANWPTISGAKPLRGELQGSYRIRTGDYRLVFRIEEVVDEKTKKPVKIVRVTKIGNRKDVYLD